MTAIAVTPQTPCAGKCAYAQGAAEATRPESTPFKWAVRAAELGAGEIVVNSMDADGTQNGYDLDLLRAISESVTIPVVASGGAGNPRHMLEAVTEGKADAALAASIFHYGMCPLREAKRFLADNGVPVRPSPQP